MKTCNSKRRHYMARVSTSLITAALIAGMVGCSPIQYNLTISSTAGGNVTTPGVGSFTYDEGTVVNLTAEAEEGYRFVKWTGNVGTIGNVNAAATNITMSGNYFVTANFAKQYNLTITSTTGGSVTTPGEGTFTYDNGSVVNLVATPDTGYRFVNWTGGVGTIANVNAAITTVTMNGNYTITANFEELLRYDLTISSSAGGSVTTPGEGTFTYYEGTVVSLVAEPEEDYYFANWTGNVSTIADVNAAITTITMNGNYEITANFAQSIPMVAAGGVAHWAHTVGLKSDGTVVAVGDNGWGQCSVSDWTDVIQIDAGAAHTVGLKSDGTVVARGYNGAGQCLIGDWTGITQVAAGGYHTVGLRADGTVVAMGVNYSGQCNVGNWTDIIQVSAGDLHTVGLKADGTVVAVGPEGRCDVGGWTDIIQVDAGYVSTVGVKADGTAVSTAYNVSAWTDIIQVSAGGYHIVGLRADGTVVAVGENGAEQCNVSNWTDIIQVSAGYVHTVGLKADGTVVAVGYNGYGQCDVDDWDLN